MRHLEVLVEEPSAEIALEALLPKILEPEINVVIRVFNGKPDLFRKLPARLRGFASMGYEDLRIAVLVDRDQDDCEALKQQLEAIARDAGLTTKSSASPGATFQVVNRIAVEELEAWFLGDVEALRQVYPRLPENLAHRKGYRDPDFVQGGTAEALGRILRQAGYHRGGLPKTRVASAVSREMDPGRNRSGSFHCFVDGLRALAEV